MFNVINIKQKQEKQREKQRERLRERQKQRERPKQRQLQNNGNNITDLISVNELDNNHTIIQNYQNITSKLSLTKNLNIKELIPYIDANNTININNPIFTLPENTVTKKLVIVSCVHGRLGLTNFCLDIWSKYKNIHKIIIVYSLEQEYETLKHLSNIHFVQHANLPLNSKWQKGITEAKQFNPDAIMILGSDDLVSQEYIDKSHEYLNNDYQYISNNIWFNSCFYKNYFIYSKLTYTRRPAGDGIGAGRIISKYLLDKCNWNLYVFKKPENKGLDGKSFMNIKCYITNGKSIFDIIPNSVLCTKSSTDEKSISFRSSYVSYIKERSTIKRDIKVLSICVYNHPKFIDNSLFIFKHFFNHSSS